MKLIMREPFWPLLVRFHGTAGVWCWTPDEMLGWRSLRQRNRVVLRWRRRCAV